MRPCDARRRRPRIGPDALDERSFTLGWRARATGHGLFVPATEDPDAGRRRAWASRRDLAATLLAEVGS